MDRTGEMRISILHFQHNDEDVERFLDVTDFRMQNLMDVKFDVFHHDKVWFKM